MSSTVRTEFHAYTERRTRAGTPWWVYALTLAVANAIRQLVLWRTDEGVVVQIGSFVAMLLIVIPLVTVTSAFFRRKRTHRRSRSGGLLNGSACEC